MVAASWFLLAELPQFRAQRTAYQHLGYWVYQNRVYFDAWLYGDTVSASAHVHAQMLATSMAASWQTVVAQPDQVQDVWLFQATEDRAQSVDFKPYSVLQAASIRVHMLPEPATLMSCAASRKEFWLYYKKLFPA